MRRDRNDPRLARPTNTQVPAVSSVNTAKPRSCRSRPGLAAGLPARLRNAVTGLDHANLTAVAGAIMAAGDHHLP